MQRPFEIRVNECSLSRLALRQKQNAQIEAGTNEEKSLREYSNAVRYRATIEAGRSRWLSPNARIIEIPASHADHMIQLRCIAPEKSEPVGVWLHFHAGGFVVGSSDMCDAYLLTLANESRLVLVSVEYRLAPENPWPAAGEDCLDATLYALSDLGAFTLGGRLRFIGGESAGSFLTVWTALALRDKGIDVRSRLDGLICSYGIYDLTYTPSVKSHQRNISLGRKATMQYIDTAFPVNLKHRKKAVYSPLYAGLDMMPPALFLVGTVDPLYDDSFFMAARWYSAGNETRLKIVAEGFHGFTLMPCDANREGIDEIFDFVRFYTTVQNL